MWPEVVADAGLSTADSGENTMGRLVWLGATQGEGGKPDNVMLNVMGHFA